jgi:hypothetical protein
MIQKEKHNQRMDKGLRKELLQNYTNDKQAYGKMFKTHQPLGQ